MLSDGGVDNATVEQDLGGVGDAVEDLEGLFEFLVVVVCECLHPDLDFLGMSTTYSKVSGGRHTCFNDIVRSH